MSNTEMFPIVYQKGDPIPAALANDITDALERLYDQGTTGQVLTKTVTGQGLETVAWAPPPTTLPASYVPPYVATFGANGVLTDFEITHNLGAVTPHVQFWEPDGTGQYVQLDGVEVISAADGNSISVSFDAEAPASGTVVNVSTGGGYVGEAAVYSTTITGDGTDTTWTITHGLNSGDITVRLRRAASGTSFTEGQDFVEESHTVTIVDVDTVSLVVTPAITDTHVWRVTVVAWDKLEVLIGSGGGATLGVADTSTVALAVTAGELTANVVAGGIDHGALAGKGDDDHAIYALADGSRGNFTPTSHTSALNVHQYTPAAAAISSGALAIDLNSAKVFVTTLNENITGITISNWTSGKLDGFQLIWTYSTATRTVAWPSGWLWPGGVAPQAPDESGERLVVDVFSVDGGATVFANAVPMKAAA